MIRPKSLKRIVQFSWASFAMLVLVAAAACGGDEPEQERPAPADAPVFRVVAVTNVLADWAHVVGGDRVAVTSLIPTDVDPHGFQPGPRDAAKIAEADLVIAVGLGMEGFWLDELLRNVARDPSLVLTLGDLVDPLLPDPESEDAHADDEEDHAHEDEEGHDDDEEEHADEEGEGHDEDEDEHADEDEGHDDEENGHADDEDADHDDEENGHANDEDEGHADDDDDHADEEDDHGHDHGAHDPHFWFDPLRVVIAIDAIAARFAEIDPANADEYRANAAAYNAELLALHAWTLEQVSTVPEGQRLFISSHDYYRYFAVRYGFEVVGIILSVAEDAEPSAEHLAHLVELMKERNVKAVFGEMLALERLASALANEAGVPLVRLYPDSLGPAGSGAETYLEMARHNVKLVVEALR